MTTLAEWFGHAIDWLVNTISVLGYPGIAVLMALESSFFPFPSEVVLPPAGFLAAQGRMSVWIAFLAGLAGSLIGAAFNYALAVALGRPLLHRYGRFLLLTERSLDRAETFFRRHGEISTFVGRLIPVIRQYISLPAGLARMRFDLFALYTALGAGIWCAVLTAIGWFLGRQSQRLGELAPGQVHRYVNLALLIMAPLIAALVAGYVIRYRRRRAES